MSADRFAILIDDLGTLIGVPLHLDSHRRCRLSIDGTLHIQIEEQEVQERILIGALITEITPGKYRENVLRETLKENNLENRLATFAYSERNNNLALFSYLYYPGLTGDKLADFLGVFIEKAASWKTAIETGQLPERGQNLHKVGPSIFDVKQ